MRRSLLASLLPTVIAAQQNVYYNSESYVNGDEGEAPTQNFVSLPDMKPPAFNILKDDATWNDNQYIFLPYRYNEGRSGLYIIDGNGSLVWGSDPLQTFEFRAHQYQGDSVFASFNGSIKTGGFGEGWFQIWNSSYDVIQEVHFVSDQGNEQTDFHELQITTNDTFLLGAYVSVPWDLTSKDGIADGWTLDCQFQELDQDNNVLFNWSALDGGISVDESYFSISPTQGLNSSDPVDLLHINSIAKDDDGSYLISLRGPSAIYKIGPDGEILWRFGGTQSDFDIADEDKFYYQHDARWLNDTDVNPRYMSLFDNNGADDEAAIDPPIARGMIWRIDQDAMTAEVVLEMPAPSSSFSGSQGNVQPLNNGAEGYMIGWGKQPWLSEFDAAGNLLYNVVFGPNTTQGIQSYRVFKQYWTGMPTTSPDVGFNDSQIFASWNGATNVTQWALATGESTDDLSVGDSFQRTGFESNSTYSSDNTFIAAVALNRDGDCLGVSRPYFASNQSVSDRAIACSSLSNVQVAAATDSDDDDDDSSASSPSLAINIVLSIFLMAVFPLS